jgi:hypothetical protein
MQIMVQYIRKPKGNIHIYKPRDYEFFPIFLLRHQLRGIFFTVIISWPKAIFCDVTFLMNRGNQQGFFKSYFGIDFFVNFGHEIINHY